MVLVDYCGATKLVPVEQGLALDPTKWGWQPKIDGAYARVSTDRSGRIASVMSRGSNRLTKDSPTGRDIPSNFRSEDLDGLLGMATGLPDAIMYGELEAYTEASQAARAKRGWSALHLFDCSRWCGQDVSKRTYSDRYGLLLRWQSDVECYGEVPREDWWIVDQQGDAHGPSGSYVRPVPKDLRRLPIVKLVRGPGAAVDLWSQHVSLRKGEGLVAVRLDAPLGKRASKIKIKPFDTLDCTVFSASGGAALLTWRSIRFVVSARGRWDGALQPGDVVEVKANGFYRSGRPKAPRIVRVRADLQ